MVRSSRITCSSAAAVAMAGTGGSSSSDDDEAGEEIESAPPLRVGEERAIGSWGIRKRLLRAGQGWATPVPPDEVSVHYVGTLPDGTVFASTRDGGGEPRTINLGSGDVIAGLEHGICTMKKGEKALFILPPLAYEDSGALGVPIGSELHFEVELLSWLTVVDVYKNGGIVKKVLSTGVNRQTGDLDEVTVKYKIKLLDESIVEESPEEGATFFVNEGHILPALPKVLKTMKEGERAVVMVQSQYAFGEQGRAAKNQFSAVPPNSAVNMDVELVSLKPVVDVTGDLKVMKKTLKSGDGIHTPLDGETVHIRYTGSLEDGTIFEKFGFDGEPFEFIIDEEQVTVGLDRAVATMVKGELAEVTVKFEYGFGNTEAQRQSITVPSCSTLIYEVELIDFTKEKESWEMSAHEKLEAAEKSKVAGNDLFKIGKFHRAAKKYNKALNYINEDGQFEDEVEKLMKTARVSCWLNHAACCLKLKDFAQAISLCSKVLETEPCNVKALYRRAQAYVESYDLELAKTDLRKALELDPNNKEVKMLQANLKKLQVESNKWDAKLYANMFDRMAKESDAVSKGAEGSGITESTVLRV
ncbi:peptidyl-prolyl cis-trans isomerase FKBP62-like isoform X2 [Panicum hallii]|uniref:peptidyl-prolyl cis-trans isomerase FKBP62-like isoform X2 n=1 Tax=Panicum hallii TaxID=206008 RepID=UPI000DF4E896|nr:peptidyl-prolyl cis-trans isomerase FKBP62-like isoform X2 [Panicum hallii]